MYSVGCPDKQDLSRARLQDRWVGEIVFQVWSMPGRWVAAAAAPPWLRVPWAVGKLEVQQGGSSIFSVSTQWVVVDSSYVFP